ncbi:flagellar basal-body rod protein FlgF [Bradyrhizobium sp. LHD-71]|uniref:flagellar basal-body rod protein FlgF n=1 Tax=Bradyrhizobium sp. LHD-71 TaxID=3072141 RepID=UPI00280CDBC8|nr:flagellar basal-body rod protein FlgF [Bradyrhizobium sp. LHD-71]MDQ8732617.1 flagellar basal-body rod protein FlgF [Bradyrhizobium sp. LHD-71]
MENTLLVGLSRQVALERQLGVVANNIANVTTTGFKADKALFEEYLRSPARNDAFTGNDRRLSFVQDRATVHDFGQGPVERTGNPLDMALDGNAFFVVQANGAERYTRNGAFQINATGQLVTNDGDQVIGTNGPITFQPGDQDISVARDGTITVREGNNTNVESTRGRLRLVNFEQPHTLQKQGANLFAAPEGTVAQAAVRAGVRQGAIEKSNVNGVAEMAKMIEVMRAYTGITNVIQQLNEVRKSSIERLADVPA